MPVVADTEIAAVHNDLETMKSAMYERSMHDGKIEIVGTLGGELPSVHWTGNISVSERLKSGEITKSDIQEAVLNLRKCYVRTQKGAVVGCVDGRRRKGYDDIDPEHFSEKQGPKVAGGTPLQGVNYRLALGDHDGSYATASIRSDARIASEKTHELEYQPGDHVDENRKPGKTGCGAIDGVEEHTEKINPRTVVDIEAGAKALLGDDFDAADFDHGLASIMRLSAVQRQYFAEKDEVLQDLIDQHSAAAPVLGGKHNEFIVMINHVRGTTLHRDHYSSLSSDKLQAFNYDIWYTYDMAAALFPDDKAAQSRYIHARVMLTLATLMDLTDGSLLLGVRDTHEFGLAA